MFESEVDFGDFTGCYECVRRIDFYVFIFAEWTVFEAGMKIC
jgi:hypothetical protein